MHLQGEDMDLAALIAEAVTPAGPLAGFCEEPGLTFRLQAKASLTQAPSQETASVPLDQGLEDEIPDDGIQSNQLAIATELMRRLLLIYFGKRLLNKPSLAALHCVGGWIQVCLASGWDHLCQPLCQCFSQGRGADRLLNAQPAPPWSAKHVSVLIRAM